MKHSPRTVNNSIKAIMPAAVAGVALYPETGDALDAALFGIDGVTTSLTIIKSGDNSDTSMAEDQLDALLLHHDVLFLQNAEVIMRHPSLVAKIGQRIADSQSTSCWVWSSILSYPACPITNGLLLPCRIVSCISKSRTRLRLTASHNLLLRIGNNRRTPCRS